jgi:polysaccharide export outer membrane protein
MQQQGINRVTVVGAVEEPGVYEMPRNSSYLLGALVAAGGLADDAGTDVEIRLPGTPGGGGGATLASYQAPQPGSDVAAAIEPGALAQDGSVRLVRVDLAGEVLLGPSGKYLGDGTVVRVERRNPKPIEVIGLVGRPGQYEYPVNHELRVLGAIAMAGGLAQQVADKVFVIRKTEEDANSTVLIEVSLHRAKRDIRENLRLAPGDIVSIEHTPATILMDAIRFVRFGLSSSVPLF